MQISGWQVVIDIFFLILCLGITYIAVSRGIVSEIFRIAGLLAGLFFAFQYFSFLGDSVKNKIGLFNKEYLYLFSFLLIFLGIGAVFGLARLIVTFLFKRETLSLRERWLCFFLGVCRAVFLSSVIIFVLQLSPVKPRYLTNTISYNIFMPIAPKAYCLSFRIYQRFDEKAVLSKEAEKYCQAQME
jgi:uncharacterized membrane protein required for colicin V production